MSSKKNKFKRGDLVEVITGSNKGKRGKVLEIKKQKRKTKPERVIVKVEGVAMKVCNVKPNQDNPEGGKIEREGFIDGSNVMSAERFDKKRTKKEG